MREQPKATTVKELEEMHKGEKPPVTAMNFVINKPALNITPEQERAMLEHLHEEMHSSRMAHDRMMEASEQFAKSYYCKE